MLDFIFNKCTYSKYLQYLYPLAKNVILSRAPLQRQITPDKDVRLERRNVGSSCNSVGLCILSNITRVASGT